MRATATVPTRELRDKWMYGEMYKQQPFLAKVCLKYHLLIDGDMKLLQGP